MIDYINPIAALTSGIIFSLYAMSGGKKIREMLIAEPEKLNSVFHSTIRFLLSSVVIVLIAMLLTDSSFSSIGLAFLVDPLSILSLISITVIVIFLLNKIEIKDEQVTKLNTDFADVSYLMPKSESEYKITIATAYAAGICEEIVFRGFLFWQLSEFIPLLPAILVANVFFALAHTGTKLKNAISSFFLGLFWSACYYYTGSLWLPILTHILVDLYSATLGYKVSLKNKDVEELVPTNQ